MRCGLQDSADLTVFNLLDIMMFFLTVSHWAVYTYPSAITARVHSNVD